MESGRFRWVPAGGHAGGKGGVDCQWAAAGRPARDLGGSRCAAARKRFGVGMSSTLLTSQAQRDLANARTNELSAVLAYDLSLVDFEAVQQVPITAGGHFAQVAR